MQDALLAALLGVVAGLATGGRLRHLGDRQIRRWPLLVVAAVLQLLADVDGLASIGLALALAAGGLLIAFAVANLDLVGMSVVLVGLALNLVVIVANGAMPVRASALVRAAVVEDRAAATDHELGGRRRLERPADRLTGLGDIVPVRSLRQVMSFGDLVVLVGVADLLAHLTHKRRPRARLRGSAITH